MWSSGSEKLSSWPSPYSTQAVILALQDKDSEKNQWFSEKRNLKQDLKTYFKEEFDHIEGVAIMTDSDNSQAEALSFYKNLFFSER